MKLLTLALLSASLLLPAASTAKDTAASPLKLRQSTLHYDCAKGPARTLAVTRITTGASGDGAPEFVVVHLQGRRYGLAQAISGSGVRYVGLLGIDPGHGMEWWEKGDEGTLSSFDNNDPKAEPQVLMDDCRVRRR